ncbi:MAG: rhodanese-like domain-containing protein [Sulfurovum sp.]|nr:rhodanese-like domain-containing protein [Sulfurovum sp.]
MSVKNALLWMIFTLVPLYARVGFEYEGISVNMPASDAKTKTIVVKRHIPKECLKIPITNETVWTGNYANPKVPEACKSTYVHTTGKLTPMMLDEDIETYGELEVLAFVKEMQKNDKMLLVDARNDEWYDYRTIPGAVNMPYPYFKDNDIFKEEFEEMLIRLGVKTVKKNEYDFSHAKTIAVFCNGPWCAQSSWMINALLEIEYPHENIKWYRGGMQDWLGAGMTSTRE